MDWAKLLSEKRFGTDKGRYTSQKYARSEFERDFDRIVFSSCFRRLQNKTQVYPLPGNIFVHNRLTHSLEVSCLGRSLGKVVGSALCKKYPQIFKQLGIDSSDIGAIVAAASLAHDVGNPCFGHSGERAISEFFITGAGQEYKKKLAATQWLEFTDFEGNANGFRLLTNAPAGKVEGGLQLTYTTLAAFMKYPCEAAVSQENTTLASRKKYGFFENEKPYFQTIAQELGLIKGTGKFTNWKRHPLVFLVEAADDICYKIIDFEDAIRLKLIHLQEGEALLKALAGKDFEPEIYKSFQDDNEKISYLRGKSINTLVQNVCEVFIQQEENILTGKFDAPLIESIPKNNKTILQQIENLSIENYYQARAVTEWEIASFEILGKLMEVFLLAVFDTKKAQSSVIKRTIPKQFLADKSQSDYIKILKITDFVSGMTDPYALELYRKITGNY